MPIPQYFDFARSAPMLPLRASPGLLFRIGRTFDFPGRMLRNLITGRDLFEGGVWSEGGATGRDVLWKLGLASRRPPKGFDLASLGTEIALDPTIALLGPLGGLTRGGKAAAALGRTTSQARAALQAARTATTVAKRGRAIEHLQQAWRARRAAQEALQAMGRPLRPLAPTLGAQARAGERYLIHAGLPFARQPLIRGAPVLEGLGRAGAVVAATRPAQWLQRAFRPGYGRPAELEPFLQLAKEEIGRGTREATEFGLGVRQELEPLLQGRTKMGQARALRQLRRARQVEGLEPRLQSLIDDLQDLGTDVDAGLAQGKKLREIIEELDPERVERVGRLFPSGRLPRRKLDERLLAMTENLRGQVARIPRIRQRVPEAGLDLSQRLHHEMERAFAEQVRAGARKPESYLRAMTKVYVERVLSPQAKKFEREFADHVAATMGKQFSAREGSQIQRLTQFVEELDDVADRFFRQRLPKNTPWFEADPSLSASQRLLQNEVSIANARLVRGVANQFGRPMRAGDTPIASLYRQLGVEPLGTRGGRVERLPNLGLPPEIAQEVTKAVRRLTDADEVGDLLRIYDRATGHIKYWLTVPWPAFHVRNFFSDTILNWLGDAADPRQLPSVLRLMTGGEVTIAGKKYTLETLKDMGILRQQWVSSLREEAGLGRSLGELRRRMPGLPAKKARARLAEASESFSRSWHFLSRKAQGATDLDAIASVKKHLFDYTELTDFERRVMRRGVLFYNWTRKVMPRLMGAFLERPAKMALLFRAVTQPTMEMPEAGLPEYIRRGVPIPVGTDPQGNPRFLFGTGAPIEEIQKFDPFSRTGRPDFEDLMRNMAMQLNPMLRYPIERLAGKDFYSNMPIPDMQRGTPLMQAITGQREPMDPRLAHFMRNLPTSRAERSAGYFLDPRRSLGQTLLQNLTGVKVSSVDPVQQARQAEATIKDLLEGMRLSGEVGQLPIYYARKREGQKSPEAQQLIKQLRQAAEKRRSIDQVKLRE